MECEHWLTDEYGIVGRCSRTKTQTGLNCSCDPDPVKQNYLPRRIVTHLVVEDSENGEKWEFGTIKDVAEVLDIDYSKLCKRLQTHTTVHHKQYSITKQYN